MSAGRVGSGRWSHKVRPSWPVLQSAEVRSGPELFPLAFRGSAGLKGAGAAGEGLDGGGVRIWGWRGELGPARGLEGEGLRALFCVFSDEHPWRPVGSGHVPFRGEQSVRIRGRSRGHEVLVTGQEGDRDLGVGSAVVAAMQ